MSTTLPPGTILQGGRYHVERVLGQGGFGITYLATHTGFGQKVALKEFFMKELCVRNEETSYVTLGSEASSAMVGRFREKFLKEARNLFCLNHKNIVRVLDIFEENGTAYFAMEYAEGGSLSQKVKAEGALPEAVATRYILQVADALRYIHGRGMNHLDIKPDNIMLDEHDNALLIDFGLAKQYDASGGQTSTTPIGFSEGYAPMEQYRQGGVAEFSPATDIYSLGATFFKLLTGVTPPPASDVYEDGVPIETLRQHGVSEAAISVIEQAMEPSKKARMNSVEDFMVPLKNEMPIVDFPKDAEETAIIAAEVENTHEYVDLGLPSGTLWATCNVGAFRPEENGDYFAWGETKPKQEYSWRIYKWMKPEVYDWMGCNKYAVPDGQHEGCWYKPERFLGIVVSFKFIGDCISELDWKDDAATANWGEGWCMPSKEQMDELRKECVWIWTKRNGVQGYEVMSQKNGRSLFLPAAGYCDVGLLYYEGFYGSYWSRSLYTFCSQYAHLLNFNSDKVDWGYNSRYFGRTVRPVRQN